MPLLRRAKEPGKAEGTDEKKWITVGTALGYPRQQKLFWYRYSCGYMEPFQVVSDFVNRVSQVVQPFWVPTCALDPQHPGQALIAYRFDDALARERQFIVTNFGYCDLVALRFVALMLDVSMLPQNQLADGVLNALSARFFRDEVALYTRRAGDARVAVYVRVLDNVFCAAGAREPLPVPVGAFVDATVDPDRPLVRVEVLTPQHLACIAATHAMAPLTQLQEANVARLPPERTFLASFSELSRPVQLTRTAVVRAIHALTVPAKQLDVAVQPGPNCATVQAPWLGRLTECPELSELEDSLTADPAAVVARAPELAAEAFMLPQRTVQTGGIVSLRFVAPLHRAWLGLHPLEDLEQAGVIQCTREGVIAPKVRSARTSRAQTPGTRSPELAVPLYPRRGGAGPVFDTLGVPFPDVTRALLTPAQTLFARQLGALTALHGETPGSEATMDCLLHAMVGTVPVSSADVLAAYDFCASPQFQVLSRVPLFSPSDLQDALLAVPGEGWDCFKPLGHLTIIPLLHSVLSRLVLLLMRDRCKSGNQRVGPVCCDVYRPLVRDEPPEPEEPAPSSEAASESEESEETTSESETTPAEESTGASTPPLTPTRTRGRGVSAIQRELLAMGDIGRRLTRRAAATAAEKQLEADEPAARHQRSRRGSDDSFEPSTTTSSEYDEYDESETESESESDRPRARAGWPRPPRNLRQRTREQAEFAAGLRRARNLRSRAPAPEREASSTSSESSEHDEAEMPVVREPASTDADWADPLVRYLNDYWPSTADDPTALAAFAVALACLPPERRPASFNEQVLSGAESQEDVLDDLVQLPQPLANLLGTDALGRAAEGAHRLPRVPLAAMPLHMRLLLLRYVTGEVAQSERARDQLSKTRVQLGEAERRLADRQKTVAALEKDTGEDEKQRQTILALQEHLQQTERELEERQRQFGEEHDELLLKRQNASHAQAAAIDRQIQRHLAKFQSTTNQTLQTRINKIRREIQDAERALHSELKGRVARARYEADLAAHRLALEASRQTLMLGTDSDGRQYYRMGSIPSLLVVMTPPGISPPSLGQVPEATETESSAEEWESTRQPLCAMPRWHLIGGDWLPQLDRFARSPMERQLVAEAAKYYAVTQRVRVQPQPESEPPSVLIAQRVARLPHYLSYGMPEPTRMGCIGINWLKVPFNDWTLFEAQTSPQASE